MSKFPDTLSLECFGEISRKSVESAYSINSLKVEVFLLNHMRDFRLQRFVNNSRHAWRLSRLIKLLITYGAKLLSADWLRQRALFLNPKGTFGNQEGIT